jgi:hypothetical protein
MPVVHLRRTVEAQADRETLLREKAPPLVVEERAIRLDAVGNDASSWAIATLNIDDSTEVGQAKECRLSAVPGEPNNVIRRRFNLLLDVSVEQVIGHMVRHAVPAL